MKKSRKASRLKQLYAESAREYRMRAILQFMTDVPEPMLSSDLMFGFRKAFPELKASHQCLMRDLRVLQERGAVCSVPGEDMRCLSWSKRSEVPLQ